jgi:adenylate kinase
MRAVLLGPPGAGKGTQADLIQARLAVPHISTGDLLRDAVENQTELGKQAKAFMEQGKLVPDELVVGLIRERLQDDASVGFLLDGFPRNLSQGETLTALLEENGVALDHVISLSVPVEELVKRMLGRGRSDDNEETIRARLEVYENETSPLCDYYRKRGVLREIDGLGSPEEISERILSQVK